MKINCAWEHNGNDTLLFATDLIGAFTRGESKDVALAKMEAEIRAYTRWLRMDIPSSVIVEITEEYSCTLNVRDADSDFISQIEKQPMTNDEYVKFRDIALKSAKDFFILYESIPDKIKTDIPTRKTFYGKAPSTAEEMYIHTKNVNEYYFAEINVNADNDGSILECRKKGFELLEKQSGFLENPVIEGSYGELWSLRKVLRRFIWHDRIHARAMYRMAVRLFGENNVENPFKL